MRGSRGDARDLLILYDMVNRISYQQDGFDTYYFCGM